MLPYPEPTVQSIMAALAEEMEAIPTDAGTGIEQRAESVVKAIKNLEAEAKQCAEEITRLQSRKSGRENQIAWLKTLIMRELIAENTRKIKTGFCTVSIRKGTKRVEVLDEKLIPKEYFIQLDPRIDKKKLMDYMKETGEIVPGTDIIEGDESLQIR